MISRTILPVTTVLLAILAIWYFSAVMLNTPFQKKLDVRAELNPTTQEFVISTLNQKRPVLPSPHQVAENLWDTIFNQKITSKRSLVYHSSVTLSSTLLGFIMGT
ncbi:MAG: ABC transporter permease, partial [Rhizobiales bacterium]|nr:ABC transporter permease [Hyphomicrobiales bacterium]